MRRPLLAALAALALSSPVVAQEGSRTGVDEPVGATSPSGPVDSAANRAADTGAGTDRRAGAATPPDVEVTGTVVQRTCMEIAAGTRTCRDVVR